MRFHRLEDWLAWLETLHAKSIDMGLERVRLVARRLGVLTPTVPVLMVSGTNGKGSTTALLDALLRAHGKRVGCYTSPHILRFNERIRIHGVEVADDELLRALAAVDAVRGDISLTYFEYTTLAALVLFGQARLDAWVLEVGLGGRLDAVNIIDADVAVLTSVGLDHQEWLGDTRESIGREKAGIFRVGRPAVVGDPTPPASVLAMIDALGADGVLAGRDYRYAGGAGGHWSWQGRDAHCRPLSFAALPVPSLALANAATALQAFVLLPVVVDPDAVCQALASVQLPGRNQRIDVPGRAIVIDVGHNADALRFLTSELPRHGLGMRFHIVLGMLGDKDIEAAVCVLEPLAASWHIAPLPSPRTASVERLAQALAAAGIDSSQIGLHADVAGALAAARGQPDGLPVLVVGSFYMAGGALAALGWQSLHHVSAQQSS